jgi:hypothetical protein
MLACVMLVSKVRCPAFGEIGEVVTAPTKNLDDGASGGIDLGEGAYIASGS